MDVSKIRIMITQDGQMKGLSVVDFTYINEIPYAVFRWEKSESGEDMPTVRVRLDPRGVMELPANSPVRYQYRAAVENPLRDDM